MSFDKRELSESSVVDGESPSRNAGLSTCPRAQ